MRILLINVPHPAIGSRIPDDHLPPLGLLSVGGPLIDDGHEVRLIDGEFGPMTITDIVTETMKKAGFERFLMGTEKKAEMTGWPEEEPEWPNITQGEKAYREAADREMVQTDRTRWDYKHQVLAKAHMPPWRLFLWVKIIEAAMQLLPKAIRRLLWNPEPRIRHAIRWYYKMGRRVWIHEMIGFFSRPHPTLRIRVSDFLGATQDHEEESMAIKAPLSVVPPRLGQAAQTKAAASSRAPASSANTSAIESSRLLETR